ncbi:MAG: histidine kinase [Bacteroidota bacterium]
MKFHTLTFGLILCLFTLNQVQGQSDLWLEQQLSLRLDSLQKQMHKQDIQQIIQRIRSTREEGLSSFPTLEVWYLLFLSDLFLHLAETDSADAVAQEALSISLAHGLEEEIQLNYFRMGTIRLKGGGFAECLPYFDSSEVYFRKTQQQERLTSCLAKKAYALAGLGQQEAAILAAEEAMALAEGIDLPELLTEVYNDVGLMYAITNDAPNCAKIFLKGYALAKEHRLQAVIASLGNNLAILFTYLHQFEKAKKYNQEAIQTCEILNLKSVKIKVLFNRVNLYLALDEVDSAQWYLDLVVDQAREADDVYLEPYIESSRGEISWKKRRYEQAHQHFRQGIALAQLNQDQKAELDALGGVARYLAHSQQHQKALALLANIIHHPLMLAIDKRELIELQSSLYETIGDYPRALEAQKRSSQIKDTVLSLERIGVAVSLETDYELQVQEARIDRLQIENKLAQQQNVQNQRTIIALLIFILLVALLGYYLSRHRRLTLQKDLTEVKESLLRLQINPHFIFNSLNSIQSSFLQEDEEKTIHLFSKFSNLMRQVLHNSEFPFVSLSEELELLTNYLELEKIRSNNKFDYCIEIEEGVNMYQVQVPSMILQIFIENAIWHGIGPKKDRGSIRILVSEEQGKHKILIEDNGVGRSFSIKHKSDDQKTKRSLGTELARQRIHQLNRKYGKGLSLNIQDRPDMMGTCVEIMT